MTYSTLPAPLTIYQTLKQPIPIMTFPPNSIAEYFRLETLLHTHQRVLRIWDSTSSSPLINHNSEYHSGFTATHERFHLLREQEYERDFHEMYETDDWRRDPNMFGSVLDHVLGDKPQKASPWITTIGCIRHAIYDITRRLALDPTREVHMSVIRLSGDSSGLRVESFDALKKAEKVLRGGFEGDVGMESLRVANAQMKVRDRWERVWYGRIFSSCIEYDTVWTVNDLPIELPRYLWSQERNELGFCRSGSWLRCLAWNPVEDEYDDMKRKIARVSS